MSSPKVAKAVRHPKTAVRPVANEADTLPAENLSASLSEDATRLAVEFERALSDGRIDALTPKALQAVTAAVCKIYSAQVEAGGAHLPLAHRTAITSTDVMTMASGLMRASGLAVFELGMWQSWTGR
jgi:hypothetical protein